MHGRVLPVVARMRPPPSLPATLMPRDVATKRIYMPLFVGAACRDHMSMMSLLLFRLHMGREARNQMRDVLAKAKASGGAYHLSAREQKDLLAVLTPLASAVNGRFTFSHRVNAAALAALLREQHGADWARCRDAVTTAEAGIRAGGGPLGRADISALQIVADALAVQCSGLSARTGGC